MCVWECERYARSVPCYSRSISEPRPYELHAAIPVLHLTARTAEEADGLSAGRYVCPFYRTTMRGPCFYLEIEADVLSGPSKTKGRRTEDEGKTKTMRTSLPPKKWILAGAAVVMQPD